MTATEVTGFDAIFSTGFFATFSRFWGARLTNYTENLEKKQKIQWRASSGDGAPKLQISVPCRGRTCPERSQPSLTETGSQKILFAEKSPCVQKALYPPLSRYRV